MYKEYHFSSANAQNSDQPIFSLGSEVVYCDRFKILSAYIPNSIDCVNESNNTISWREGATIFYVTIPSGRYDLTTFPAALETAMNDSPSASTFTVQYNLLTRRITIGSSGTFQVLPGSNGTSLWRVLGMQQNQLPSSGGSFTSGVCDFTSNAPLILSSGTLSSRNSIMVGQGTVNCLGVIPMDSQPGSFVNYIGNGGWLQMGQELNVIDFKLIDSTSRQPVSLNGNGWFVSVGILTDADDLLEF